LVDALVAFAVAFGFTEEDFLAGLETDGFFDQTNVKGYSNTRLIGFATAGFGLIGTALAFV
jgi:hypothetical protein